MNPTCCSAALAMALLAVALAAPTDTAYAQTRARADVLCKPRAEMHQYECAIRLTRSGDNEPLSGINLSVRADMPSMPGMHRVTPVTAAETSEKGTYRARIVLDMYGDWALHLDLAGPMRDRVVKVLRFEPGRVREVSRPAEPSAHKH